MLQDGGGGDSGSGGGRLDRSHTAILARFSHSARSHTARTSVTSCMQYISRQHFKALWRAHVTLYIPFPPIALWRLSGAASVACLWRAMYNWEVLTLWGDQAWTRPAAVLCFSLTRTRWVTLCFYSLGLYPISLCHHSYQWSIILFKGFYCWDTGMWQLTHIKQ